MTFVRPLRRLLLLRRVQPWPTLKARGRSAGVHTDAQIEEFLREAVTTDYHYAGTCRLGRDPMGVVAPNLRVHGVEGLSVVDASVMPTPLRGNINAPCIAIGARPRTCCASPPDPAHALPGSSG